ncbi:hypothetical protein [Candidatus Poriferisodalis sp.]|uniref:hypothetical protein n=1 Tax=Candidatus Poriferisodalis sp. TaxID=3101277 RepID=UPI003B01E127
MLLWFVATSLLAMRWSFGDPAIDHRIIVAGALLPDVLYTASGGAPVTHSLMLPAAGLVAVMLVTMGRRRARRRWLALPIGVFWHQLFDGAWLQSDLFWWPVGGVSIATTLPLASRPVWLNVAMESAGIAGCWWVWRSAGFAQDPARRADFWRAGRLRYPAGSQQRRDGGT